MRPRLDILPAEQRRLWPELSQVPKHFVLYGGTAIALRLGGRQSVDFDFFTSQPVSADVLGQSLAFLAGAKLIQSELNTASFMTSGSAEVVACNSSETLDLRRGSTGKVISRMSSRGALSNWACAISNGLNAFAGLVIWMSELPRSTGTVEG